MGLMDGLRSLGLVAPEKAEEAVSDEELAELMAEGKEPQAPKGGPPKSRPGGGPPSQPGAPPSAPRPLQTGSIRSFPEIYAVGGIVPPAHGFTVDKVLAVMEMPHMTGLDPVSRKAAVLAVLGMQGVPTVDIVKDAVERSKVLSDYEMWLLGQNEKADSAANAEVQRLEEDLAEFTRLAREKIDAIRKAPAMRAQVLATWQEAKAQELRRLHDAAALALAQNDPNPILLPRPPAPPEPPNPFKGFGS